MKRTPIETAARNMALRVFPVKKGFFGSKRNYPIDQNYQSRKTFLNGLLSGIELEKIAKHFYVYAPTKNFFSSSEKYVHTKKGFYYVGYFASEEDCVQSLMFKTRRLCLTNDSLQNKLFELNETVFPENLPSFEKLHKVEDQKGFLLWLYVVQMEKNSELECQLRKILVS